MFRSSAVTISRLNGRSAAGARPGIVVNNANANKNGNHFSRRTVLHCMQWDSFITVRKRPEGREADALRPLGSITTNYFNRAIPAVREARAQAAPSRR